MHQPWTSPNESRALWLRDRRGKGAMFLGWKVCGWSEEDSEQHKARGEDAGLSPRLWVLPTAAPCAPLLLTQPLFCLGNYGAVGMQPVPGGNAVSLFLPGSSPRSVGSPCLHTALPMRPPGRRCAARRIYRGSLCSQG